MAYDIYGNNLQRGCCEVHPYVHQEYPCSICLSESMVSKRENDYHKQQEEEYYKHLEEEHDREERLYLQTE